MIRVDLNQRKELEIGRHYKVAPSVEGESPDARYLGGENKVLVFAGTEKDKINYIFLGSYLEVIEQGNLTFIPPFPSSISILTAEQFRALSDCDERKSTLTALLKSAGESIS